MIRLYEDNTPKRIKYLQKLIKKKKSCLINAPQGRIKIFSRGAKSYYSYYASDSSDLRYLRLNDKSDMALAKSIAQRDYDLQVLRLAENELKLLENELTFYQKGSADDFFDTLNQGRQALVTPIRLTDEQYVERWLAQSYPKKPMNPTLSSYETKRGEDVRSKSEKMIADDLYSDDIPYLYEKTVPVIDLITGQPINLHPDFTVLNVRTRKTYLWEHWGKCDDAGYMNDNVKKIREYQNAGYTLGENLIVTFETRAFPLTPEQIQTVKKCYLI